MKPPFVRSAYNYDRDQASNESGLKCEDESLAKQSFLEDSDINVIVKRFGLTGEMPTGLRMPTYGDFDQVTDFHSAMNAVVMANETFDQLPAEVRAKFQNDPGQFVDFCLDENNLAEARKMGLVQAETVQQAAQLAVPIPTPPPEETTAPKPD